MSDIGNHRGKEILDLNHPDCQKDEVFMQYVNQLELDLGIKPIWNTIRFEIPIPDGIFGRIYPVFVKKQELLDTGVVLIPARNFSEKE